MSDWEESMMGGPGVPAMTVRCRDGLNGSLEWQQKIGDEWSEVRIIPPYKKPRWPWQKAVRRTAVDDLVASFWFAPPIQNYATV